MAIFIFIREIQKLFYDPTIAYEFRDFINGMIKMTNLQDKYKELNP